MFRETTLALNVEHLLRTAATREQALLALDTPPVKTKCCSICTNWPGLQEALRASPLPMLVEAQLWRRLAAGSHGETDRSDLVVQGGRWRGDVSVAGTICRGRGGSPDFMLRAVPGPCRSGNRQ